MSGIIGYIGNENSFEILVNGMSKLQYKGYDSVGLATLKDGAFDVRKSGERVKKMVELGGDSHPDGTIGVGHLRWATHGEVSEKNTHPHISNSGKILLVHKGIVENYASLKEVLVTEGYTFESDTDSEVLVNWIEYLKNSNSHTTLEAMQLALNQVVGAYSIILLDRDENALYAVRKGAQLVIGVKENQYFVATDTSPLVAYVENVIYMDENDIYRLSPGEEIKVLNLQNYIKSPTIEALEENLEIIEKEGYEHFMLKEIYEQPTTIYDSFRGRLNSEESWVRLGGVWENKKRFALARRIIFAACGTSYHASLIAKYIIESLARIPVEVEYASEFIYRNPIIDSTDIFVAISQSGETADTISAINIAKERGALVYGVVNTIGSTISRLSHAGSYTHAGKEIGIASTKAFTSQVVILTLMALQLAHTKGMLSDSELNYKLNELEHIPAKIEEILKLEMEIKSIAETCYNLNSFLFLGRGINYPIALEGALKLKEISYIHAEGMPAAEIKHGPLALIDEEMMTVVIANKGESYEKIISNIKEVKARKGRVIAVVSEGDEYIKDMVDFVIEIPDTLEEFTPLLTVIPLQILAYHIALFRGVDVDSPRNLTKSVTVE